MTVRHFNDERAPEALHKANFIALAPFIFAAAKAMRDLGFFRLLADSEKGLTKRELADKAGVTLYAASVLIDAAYRADMVCSEEEETGKDTRWILTKTGLYLATDRMTEVNLSFSADVCAEGLLSLTESLKTGKPAGLRTFSETASTIYPLLETLPEPARTSWFDYDHFYSDHVFEEELPILRRETSFRSVCDVGGNTGKFALAAAAFDPDVHVTIADLPEQCAAAKEKIADAGLSSRIALNPCDILKSSPADLPGGIDVWWMSQFLDCFSSEQAVQILRLVRDAMEEGAVLAVNEIFGDRQRRDTAALVVDECSLYFTAIANGVSRFFNSAEFMECLAAAGFKVKSVHDALGLGHTLIIAEKA
ncbi:MAG: methyltransferase [Succinivibrionaceae bacterium]|nr:methyltransferase [Succinivibrionaceae bacterium]